MCKSSLFANVRGPFSSQFGASTAPFKRGRARPPRHSSCLPGPYPAQIKACAPVPPPFPVPGAPDPAPAPAVSMINLMIAFAKGCDAAGNRLAGGGTEYPRRYRVHRYLKVEPQFAIHQVSIRCLALVGSKTKNRETVGALGGGGWN